jgi:hypothetical protein
MINGITYQPSVTHHNGHVFGMVNIIIGTRIMSSRVIRIARADKAVALADASKLARAMVALGANCPINLNDYQ